jgi:hypothetical protein
MDSKVSKDWLRPVRFLETCRGLVMVEGKKSRLTIEAFVASSEWPPQAGPLRLWSVLNSPYVGELWEESEERLSDQR